YQGVHAYEITLATPGVAYVTVSDDDSFTVTSNPIRVLASWPERRTFRGDLHGHHGQVYTLGAARVDEYMEYARDVADLDFACESGKSSVYFNVPEVWAEEKESLTQYESAEFVPILGYEWMGKESLYQGHHNVYFPGTDGEMYRPDDAATNTLDGLYEAHADDDVVIVPHASSSTGFNWRVVHRWDRNDRFRLLGEIYSHWDNSEWEGPGALRAGWVQGNRMGVIAATDNHFGLPGLPLPDVDVDGTFNAPGGLMAVKATALTRTALWEAMQSRRTYGTTGARILLDFTVDGSPMGSEITASGAPTLTLSVDGAAELTAVEVLRGVEAPRGSDIADADLYYTKVLTAYPGALSYATTLVDDGFSGDAFYYVRVTQSDGEQAWSSPVWVADARSEVPDLWTDCGNGVQESGETLQNCPTDMVGAVASERWASAGFGRLVVGGTTLPMTGLTLYNPIELATSILPGDPGWNEFITHQIRLVKEAGMSYLVMGTSAPELYDGPPYPDDAELADDANWDWATYDQVMDYAAREGVSIILTFNVSAPAGWWAQANPDDMQTDSDGVPWDRPSFSSDSHRQWAGKLLTVFINHFKDHPALLVWDLRVGQGENNYSPPYTVDIFDPPTTWCDYSPRTLERFRSWLEAEYGTVAALRSAWGDPGVSFATARLPLPLDDVLLATREQALPFVNSPGDDRREYHDWTRFRSAQKMDDAFYFAGLVRDLDPDHIVISDPAFAPLQGCSIKDEAQDGAQLYQSDLFDGTNVHPRVAHDDGRSSFNTSRLRLHSFDRYNLHHGKLGFWSQEETNEVYAGEDVEVVWRLHSLMALHAVTGMGHGMVTGNEAADVDGILPAWSESELAEFNRKRGIFSAPDPAPLQPRVALLADDFHESFTYYFSGPVAAPATPTGDRQAFIEGLFAQGLEFDLITTVDVLDSPSTLDRYDAVVLLDLPRLGMEVAELLAEFRDDGGGLFIGGRTSLYDTYGNPDTTALETLLQAGVADFTTDADDVAGWSFVGSDPVVQGLKAAGIGTSNAYYIPQLGIGARAYTKIAQLTGASNVTVAGRKGKTVFWFPQLAVDDTAVMMRFQKNLWELWEQTPAATAAKATESVAGSYQYVFTAEPTTVTVALDEGFGHTGALVWDWLSMEAVDVVQTGSGPAADISSGENTTFFLGFTPLNAGPQLVAFQGAYLHGQEVDPAAARLSAAFYRAAALQEVTVVIYPGASTDLEVAVHGGEVTGMSPDDSGLAVVVRVRPYGERFTLTAIGEVPTDGCAPDALCLNDGRFRVEAEWRDFDGNSGSGRAVALTSDTGYFWFFSDTNVELIVKVLDGTAVNGYYWVFFGALSNVEYTITVTDTLAGNTVTYTNPLGNFASVGDTTALPGIRKSGGSVRRIEVPVNAPESSVGTCTMASTNLCLNAGRFKVEVTWNDFVGNTGSGQAVSLTSDTGYFWFFSDTNVELVVKVLDGTALNGHFWVFYGALSNVEYTLTVTDTVTNEVKSYKNPSGNFGSVGDTSAF
ncbi:MAG: DUF3604 domain-containing protein, partial [bacterium]|nr:DUF3604 domain-containing protein [bacterium]